MPNELLNPKGDYEITRRHRRVDQRRKELFHNKNLRIHLTQTKHSVRDTTKVIGLYLGLYVLCAIIVGCNLILVKIFRVPENEPFERKSTSLSSVPGNFVGYRKVIRYHVDQRNAFTPYVSQINDFVARHGLMGFNHLRACNLDNYWGYNIGQPCLLLKLNHAINFNAETYTSSIELPTEVPNDLHNYVLQLPFEDRIDRIWAGCIFLDNATNALIEYIPYRYYDAQGLFEKENIFLRTISENLTDEESYEIPTYRRIIGAQFQNMPMNRDVAVKCSIWAKNIPKNLASTIVIFRIEGLEVLPPPAEYDDNMMDD